MNNARTLFVAGFMVLFFFVLVLKLFNIQISKHEHYKYLAEVQQKEKVSILPERGKIEDRNGIVFAYTKNDKSYYIDADMLKARLRDSKMSKVTKQQMEQVASKFADVFESPKNHYLNIMDNGRNNTYLEKKAPVDKSVRLKNFAIDWLREVEDHTRIYPMGTTASHILGYLNSKEVGLTGIEKQYENFLKGKEGSRLEERDVLGRTVEVIESLSQPAIPGCRLILTINSNYQRVLEESLREGIKNYGAQSATGIIMDPNTGEILAMADLPDFDPANHQLVDDETRRNRSLTDPYEPGSTMKAFSMSMLIDEGKVRADKVINTENGYYKYHGENIKDSHPFASLTVKDILMQSSNIGMTKLSEEIEPYDFYKYLRDFGFGNKTGLDLPGESGGSVKKPDAFKKSTKARMSFGYELTVTPLQLLTAFCALVNGGSLYKPFLVKEIIDPSGEFSQINEPTLVRRVIDEKTSSIIKEWMVSVVEEGTGQSANSSIVKIGGKTGTSHKYDIVAKKYSENNFNSSFIGFFPADQPKVVCLILFNSPKTEIFGGKVAAPVFKTVAERIIELDSEILKEQPKHESDDDRKDFITSLNAEQKGNQIKTFNYQNKSESKTPPKTNNIIKGVMPDLMGVTASKAISLLAGQGLNYEIKGKGKVTWQSIEPGTKIKSGETCRITCENTSKNIPINLN
ncbi:MAG: penicillin-binding protein [bacterium]